MLCRPPEPESETLDLEPEPEGGASWGAAVESLATGGESQGGEADQQTATR